MLVWIASYPGSLDHLFLHVIYERFGIHWYESEIEDQSAMATESVASFSGQKAAKGSWRSFYERAIESNRLVLARTRMPPTDALPFIYLSRNGSEAIRNFHHQNLRGKTSASLSSTILGHHMYGDWTGHYQNWRSRSEQENGKFLTIEEFIANPDAIIDEILPLLGHPSSLNAGLTANQMQEWLESELSSYEDLLPPEAALYGLIHGESASARGYPGPDPTIAGIVDFISADTLLKHMDEQRKSIRMIGQMHEMSGYIASLKNQLSEETERLRDYVDVLKDENSRLKNGE